MSFVEALTNIVVGFALALVTQFTIFPMFGLAVTVTNNLVIGGIFTAVSMVRSFTLRRLFEAVRVRRQRCVRQEQVMIELEDEGEAEDRNEATTRSATATLPCTRASSRASPAIPPAG